MNIYGFEDHLIERSTETFMGKEIKVFIKMPGGWHCTNIEPNASYGYPYDALNSAREIVRKNLKSKRKI